MVATATLRLNRARGTGGSPSVVGRAVLGRRTCPRRSGYGGDRRQASSAPPRADGGWFADPARAAGTLSVIGTMFAVILAFVIFLALQSYQRARNGSSAEAVAITELHSVAQVFQSPSSDRLQAN